MIDWVGNRKTQSPQETFVKEVSQNLLGPQSVFQPEKTRGGRREPADLVWLAGRCAVIIHMTSKKGAFDKKRSHNNKQLAGWLRDWRRGEILSNGDEISLAYSDVDYIVGISVVGGDDVACLFQFDQIEAINDTAGDQKLVASATISQAVFDRLGKRSVGLRDVVRFLSDICSLNRRVSDREAVALIERWENLQAAEARKQFENILARSDQLNRAWGHARVLLQQIRKSEGADCALLADLSVSDIIWMSVAEECLGRQLAPPGQFGPLLLGASRKLGDYYLDVICAANYKAVSDYSIARLSRPGMQMYAIMELGLEAPIKMVAIGGPSQPLLTHQALEALRDFAAAQDDPTDVSRETLPPA